MAENIDVAQAEARPADGSVLDRLPMRDEDGGISPRVRRGDRARHPSRRPAAFLREVVAELHEADLGDLIEALEPDDRVTPGRTDRHRFRLLGAERGRRRRPRGNPRGTRTGDGRGGRSRTGIRRRRRTARRPRRGGPGRDPRKAAAVRARRAGAQPADYPENSAGRRMQTEFIAVPPDWTVGQAIDYMRDTPDLPDRFYEIYAVDADTALAGRGRRSTRCCARAGRCRSPT